MDWFAKRKESYCNSTKSLLGIETAERIVVVEGQINCNSTKSLLGIETEAQWEGIEAFGIAIPLNPS